MPDAAGPLCSLKMSPATVEHFGRPIRPRAFDREAIMVKPELTSRWRTTQLSVKLLNPKGSRDMADPDLIADGKRHGIVVTDYLLDRIKLTAAVAVDVMARNVNKHANEMLANGRTGEDVAAWVRAVRSVFQERLTAVLVRDGSAQG